MWKPPTEKQKRRLQAMKSGRQRAERVARGRAPELPLLRRTVVVTDYDSGTPVVNTLELFRTGRVDCYRAVANGKPWIDRVGWSKALAGLRKAYVRVPGRRSDFWW